MVRPIMRPTSTSHEPRRAGRSRRHSASRRLAGLSLIAWLCTVGPLAMAGEPSTSAAGKPKNLLMVTFDALRFDHVGAYGYERDTTPHFDRFAKSSVLYEHAYCQIPSTAPAMATVMTGKFPAAHGVLETYKYKLSPDELTLAELLKDHGFRTGAFVGTGTLMPDRRINQGFDEYSFAKYTNKQYWRQADDITDTALDWIGSGDGEPFFAWVHFFEPHLPHDIIPEEYREKFRDVPSHHPMLSNTHLGSAQKQSIKKRIDYYDGATAYADAQLARLFAFMDKKKLTDQTVIIVSADHGEGLGEHHLHGHVHKLYEPVVVVPLLVRVPGGTDRQSQSERPARRPLSDDSLDLRPEGPVGASGTSPRHAGDREGRREARRFFRSVRQEEAQDDDQRRQVEAHPQYGGGSRGHARAVRPRSRPTGAEEPLRRAAEQGRRTREETAHVDGRDGDRGA